MGFSEKAQVEGAFDLENNSNRKWVIAGIALRGPLKPIFTSVPGDEKDEVESEECCCSKTTTTPTSVESKIPTPFTCPPAPRKRKQPSLKCNYRSSVVVTQFFTPPDLESVFIPHLETAISSQSKKIK